MKKLYLLPKKAKSCQQIATYLFIFPFLGIFAYSWNLLFGAGVGSQLFLTFVSLSLLILTAGWIIFKCKTWHVKLIDAVWSLFVLYVAINCFVQSSHPFIKLHDVFVVSCLYVFYRVQAPTLVRNHKFTSPMMLFALLGLGICAYGLLQYAGFYPSRNGYFTITSFFINPAPLTIFLTVLCPYLALSLWRLSKLKEIHYGVLFKKSSFHFPCYQRSPLFF